MAAPEGEQRSSVPTMSPFGSESPGWNFGKMSPTLQVQGPDFTALNSTCSFPSQGLYLLFLLPVSLFLQMCTWLNTSSLSPSSNVFCSDTFSDLNLN